MNQREREKMEIVMNAEERNALFESCPVLEKMSREEEVLWINPDRIPYDEAKKIQELSMEEIEDAEKRLARFAPFIMRKFPETKDHGGLIESELVGIPKMKEALAEKYGAAMSPGFC